MTRVRCLLALPSLMLWAPTPLWSQSQVERGGFWASVQLGHGSVDMASDQEPGKRRGAFAVAFKVGGTVTPHVRLGAELSGWLLQSFDVNDPAKGESVTHVFGIGQLYPLPARGLFLKAGAGRATYINNHPSAFGSSGWGGTFGVGYDARIASRISVTPVVHYSRGSLGRVANQLVSIQNRRYRVVDLGVAITFP